MSNVYEKFIKEYESIYWNTPLEETIQNILPSAKKIGSGTNKIVYLFPNLEDYVIAYLYKKEPLDKVLPFTKVDLRFPKYSFSQTFLTNNYDIEIEEFIKWTPNSVDDYISVIKYICDNNSATQDMAKQYLEKINLFKDFPIEAYDKFAKQLEYLKDNGQFIDSANPNNLLIDTEWKEFNLIDLFTQEFQDAHKKIIKEEIVEEWASIHDMICILLDSKFHPYYLEKLNNDEQNDIIKISKFVIDNCITAWIKTKLSRKWNLMKTIHSLIPHWHPIFNENCYRRYTEFLELYDDKFSKLNID